MSDIGPETGEQAGFGLVSGYLSALPISAGAKYLYRGHAKKEWELVPSIFREGAKGIRNSSDLARWKSEAMGKSSPRPGNDVEWLILAQHYGIATPLLDWTENPLVALYFACENSSEDGVIWQVRRPPLRFFRNLETVSAFKKNREEAAFIEARGLNLRSEAQAGVLSLHPPPDSPFGVGIPGVFTKQVFYVQGPNKNRFLWELAQLGISKKQLFSDITNIAEIFVEELK